MELGGEVLMPAFSLLVVISGNLLSHTFASCHEAGKVIVCLAACQ